MGIAGENICSDCKLTREELDEFSLQSQQKALRAIASGAFRDEIVPVEIPGRKGPTLFDTDQQPRETTAEGLPKLRPAFQQGGMVTPGNSSCLNDGRTARGVRRLQKAHHLRVTPLA